MPPKRYDPMIGSLVVEFVDFYELARLLQLSVNEALRNFAKKKALNQQITHRLAAFLEAEGWNVHVPFFDPKIMEPHEFEGGYTGNIFDQYDNALKIDDYETAEEIYQTMTPSQKSVVKSASTEWTREEKREMGHWLHEVRKRELEKENKREEEKKLKEKKAQHMESDFQEILDIGQDLIEGYHQMNLPPQSMTVFMPFGHMHDDAVRKEGSDEAMEKYLRAFGRVLAYLEQQGYNADEHKKIVQEYADYLVPELLGLSAAQNRKLLSFAAELRMKGSINAARQIIQSMMDEPPFDETKQLPPEAMEAAMEGIDVMKQYEDLLVTEQWLEAKALYAKARPELHEILDEVGRRYFAATNIMTLHRFGQKLYDKQHFTAAYKIKKIVESQIVDLPLADQQQIVVLLLPEGADLPQAFQQQKQNSKKQIDEKMEDMMGRLENQCPTAKTIEKLLKLADRLDEQGNEEAAVKLDEFIADLNKQADHPEAEQALQDRFAFDEDLFSPEELSTHREKVKPVKEPVSEGTCQSCGKDYLYRGSNPLNCPGCKKDIYPTRAGGLKNR